MELTDMEKRALERKDKITVKKTQLHSLDHHSFLFLEFLVYAPRRRQFAQKRV